ncbi:MAG: MBOAT family protein [Bacteroidetes bacterium]|nr:MBOAT family protein [Bacteroidota bacterium]
MFWIFIKYKILLTVTYNILFATYHDANQWIVPVGLGLITLQQISYLSECYKKRINNVNIVDYLVFSVFFPKLIAGPIMKFNDFISHFKISDFRINYYNVSLGLYVFSIGLFKKVIFADTFMHIASNGFGSVSLNFVQAWIVAISNTLGIFFDISGYTDMAVGIGLFFNIKLLSNFNYPFKAVNIKDYWVRWHTTFTGFFMNNIYEPITKKKKTWYRMAIGIFLAFLIMSFWHKLSIAIVVWGLLNASALVCFLVFEKLKIKIPDILAWLLTFVFLNICWLFFRAGNITDAFIIIKGMANIKSIFIFYNEYYILWAIGANFIIVLFLILGLYVVTKMKNVSDLSVGFIPTYGKLIITLILLIIGIIFNNNNTFIYYGF